MREPFLSIAILVVVLVITVTLGVVVFQEMEEAMQPDNLCESKFGDKWSATNNSTGQSGIYCVAENGTVREHGPINLSGEIKEANERIVDPWD